MKEQPKHYQGVIQPVEFIAANNLCFIKGNIIKYVYRAGNKDGESNLKDLRKAKHYLEMAIELAKNGELHATIGKDNIVQRVLECTWCETNPKPSQAEPHGTWEVYKSLKKENCECP